MRQVGRMKRKTLILLAAAGLVFVSVGTRAAIGFPVTHHAAEASTLGETSSSHSLEAVVDQPGPVTVETVVGCDWSVPLSGLVNLDHPKAVAAGLKDRDEPIVVVFHAIRHPTKGLFLVDTGVERALRDDPAHAAVGGGVVGKFMHLGRMRFRKDTASWLAEQHEAPRGVFLTHLHLDHVSGMRDVPNGTPVYVGAGETSHRQAINWFVQSSTDAALDGKTVYEWKFAPDPDGQFVGVIDVFGDGSFWALHVPGHTSGSTAYLARTPKGPVLMTGDASHTVWGWDNGVEPGSFSENRNESADSLARLKRLVERHPSIEVRVGHQLPPAPK